MKRITITFLILALTLSLGCTGMSSKQQSALSGAGIGAVGGGVLGAATGAVIGAGVGGAAGYLI